MDLHPKTRISGSAALKSQPVMFREGRGRSFASSHPAPDTERSPVLGAGLQKRIGHGPGPGGTAQPSRGQPLGA